MSEAGQIYQQTKPPKVHSMKNYRRVPTKALLRRLRIAKYEVPTPFVDGSPAPDEVRILLQQHAGKPAIPVVQPGVSVQVGDLLADIPEDSLGARIHASLAGKVSEVTDNHIRIVADAGAKSGGKVV